VATGIKMGFLLSFVLSLILQFVSYAIISPETFRAFSNPNVAAALFVMTLVNSAIVGALGAAGGLIGNRIFKKKEPKIASKQETGAEAQQP